MKRSVRPLIAPALLATAMAVAMAAPPGARAQSTPADSSHNGASQPAPSGAAARGQRPGYTAADVHFMQGMIAHHAQAMAMTSLVPDRSTSEAIHLVAQRIRVSQRDEIALMRNWLRKHGEDVPSPDTTVHLYDRGSHSSMPAMPGMAGGDSLMPGMLTREQMLRLASSRGDEFDRLFLKFMIQHHKGALAMVATLFGSKGAGQQPEMYRFASDVDTDQRMEIERMGSLLRRLEHADSHE